jgi:hypothetical protein
MGENLHPESSGHLPSFITAPGETDVLMVIMAVVLALVVLGFGILFFRLHTLPERMAHKGKKLQFEIVAVLGLIALFTHMHIFWIAGLLLALVEFPDFGTPLNRIAGSVARIAGGGAEAETASEAALPQAAATGNVEALVRADSRVSSKAGNSATGSTRAKPEIAPAARKELSHHA